VKEDREGLAHRRNPCVKVSPQHPPSPWIYVSVCCCFAYSFSLLYCATDKKAENRGNVSIRGFGYRIGIPEDPKTRALFLAKVKMSMYAIHQDGIVHMDFYFYPSNIMLREVGYGVVVKIIDWDAVHDVNENLVGVVVNKFNRVGQEFRRSLFSKCGGQNLLIAETAWDSSLFEVLARNIDDPGFKRRTRQFWMKPLCDLC
jgi:hypothetical protein